MIQRLLHLGCLAWFGAFGLPSLAAQSTSENEPLTGRSLLMVLGADGTPEYGEKFRAWLERWRNIAAASRMRFHVVGAGPVDPTTPDVDSLAQRLKLETAETNADLWIVLLGHGTFDRREAKFNLRGRDLSANEFAKLLAPVVRPMVVVNCAASSGPFVTALRGPRRVVISATKSGAEQNFARFGDGFSRAWTQSAADFDGDGSVSLLEAFLFASAETAEFYESAGRIVVEHALLDDDGDGNGARADAFHGLELKKTDAATKSVDGQSAATRYLKLPDDELNRSDAWRARRDELERELRELKHQKDELPADDYWKRFESVARRLAQLYVNP